MSFDHSFRGGFGPFVLGHQFFPGGTFDVMFLVQKRDTDILVTLPDAQLVGYICTVVPNSYSHDKQTYKVVDGNNMMKEQTEYHVKFQRFRR